MGCGCQGATVSDVLGAERTRSPMATVEAERTRHSPVQGSGAAKEPLVGAGTELVPWGMVLGMTGTPLGRAGMVCGNEPGVLPPEAWQSLSEPRGGEPDAAWFTEDLRRPCGCGDRARRAALDREARRLISELKPAATPRRQSGRPTGWSDALRGAHARIELSAREKVAVRDESGDPRDRHDEDDPRPDWDDLGGSSGDGAVVLPRPDIPGPVTLYGCSGGMTVLPQDIDALRGMCEINLDPGGYASTGVVQARLPSSYVPTRSKSEMKQAYWPEWMTRCVPTGESDWASAAKAIRFTTTPMHGLFWDDGWGFYYGHLLHAVRTVYGYRAIVDDQQLAQFADPCNMSSSAIAWLESSGTRWLDDQTGWCTPPTRTYIQARADGAVLTSTSSRGSGSTFTPNGFLAYTAFGQVHMCAPETVWRAAIADYYLWWAWRLYSAAMDSASDFVSATRLYLTGKLAAQAALSEIVETAALLVHELGHLFGNSFHCADYTDDVARAGWGALLGSIIGSTINPGWGLAGLLAGGWLGWRGDGDKSESLKSCCQYIYGYAFGATIRARLGLQTAHTSDLTQGDTANERFENWAGRSSTFGYGAIGACEQKYARFWKESFTTYGVPNGVAEVEWFIDSNCTEHITDTAVLS